MNEISGTEKQSDVIIEPVKEDTWKFFDAGVFKILDNTRVVSISQLILENIEEHPTGLFTIGQNHPVYKAYNYFRRATEGDSSVKLRAPITVRANGDGTFTIVDRLATTLAAKILGWKFLPVQIIEAANREL